MKKLLLFLMLVPSLGFTQTVNEVDANGLKQGVWEKTFDNGNLRYKGRFMNDNPHGIFMYYYDSGELQAEKEFFHEIIFCKYRVKRNNYFFTEFINSSSPSTKNFQLNLFFSNLALSENSSSLLFV